MEENVFSIEYILKNGLDKSAYGFIYITTNMINGKKYIGQKRFDNLWRNYLGSGVTLKKAIKKYGKENFSREIVALSYSKIESNLLEIEFIKIHNAVDNEDYYNISTGGDSGSVGSKYIMSEDHKQKISLATKGKTKNRTKKRKGVKGTNLGIKKSEETKLKMSNSRIKLTKEQVFEIREKYSTGKYKQVELSKEYFVDYSTISNVVNFKKAYKRDRF